MVYERNAMNGVKQLRMSAYGSCACTMFEQPLNQWLRNTRVFPRCKPRRRARASQKLLTPARTRSQPRRE